METDYSKLAPSQLDRLNVFRFLYLEIRDAWSGRRSSHLNPVELAVVLTRGGRRVPYWLRALRTEVASSKFPLHDLNEALLHKHFHEIEELLSIHRVVPKTKRRLFATYLAGQVCATASSLVDFAGIAHSTAHKWLYRCTEFKLLEVFQTDHEVFYLQPALLQLVLVGTTEKQHLMRFHLEDELAELRRRSRNWLQMSALTKRLDGDHRLR